MGLERTYLTDIVNDITKKGSALTQYRYTAHIYTGSEWITPIAVHNVYLKRDYENSFTDLEMLTVMVGLGDYAYAIYPNRDKIVVELVEESIYTMTADVQKSAPVTAKRYRGVLLNQQSVGMSTSGGDYSDRATLNKGQLIQVEFQLMDEAAYQVRMATVGRNYRYASPMDVLLSALTENRTAVVANSEQLIHGVEVTEGYNTKKRDQIVIKPVALTDLVAVLQDKEGGLYSAGAGCYLQNGFWYVYPLYNLNVMTKAPRTLTLVIVPPRMYQGEYTYMQTGSDVTVIISSNSNMVDSGLHEQINEANGYRLINANTIMDPTTTESNKTKVDRSKNLFEFTSTAFSDSTNNVQWGQASATSNPFPHYTELAKRACRTFTVQWTHSDPDLLTPGMPVRILATADNAIIERQGVLKTVETNRVPIDSGPLKHTYTSISNLEINIKREGL